MLTCDCLRDFWPLLKAALGMYGGGAPVSSSGGTFQPYTPALSPSPKPIASRIFCGKSDLQQSKKDDYNFAALNKNS